MTISAALKKYRNIEVELLLGHVLKQSKEFLYLHSEQNLSSKQKSAFEVLVEKRIKGIPIAYLLGYKYFYDLKFNVNRNVLIPRPETEWLVDRSLRVIKTKLKANPEKQLRILDVGTGSGCIAISISKNTDPKKVQVFATDISESALNVAKENSKTLGSEVRFSKHDLLKGVTGKFDVVISNPPYVPHQVYDNLKSGLKFEPRLALVDSVELNIYKNLLAQAQSKMNKTGVLLLEIDPSGKSLLQKFMKKMPKQNVKFYKDIQGLWRYCQITKRLSLLK